MGTCLTWYHMSVQFSGPFHMRNMWRTCEEHVRNMWRTCEKHVMNMWHVTWSAGRPRSELLTHTHPGVNIHEWIVLVSEVEMVVLLDILLVECFGRVQPPGECKGRTQQSLTHTRTHTHYIYQQICTMHADLQQKKTMHSQPNNCQFLKPTHMEVFSIDHLFIFWLLIILIRAFYFGHCIWLRIILNT